MTKYISSILFFAIVFTVSSCGPFVKATSNTSLAPLPLSTNVTVIPVEERTKIEGDYIGTIQIGENGLTIHCSYSDIHNRAKLEALKMGGDIIKVTQLIRPGILSTCFRLKGSVYKNHSKKL